DRCQGDAELLKPQAAPFPAVEFGSPWLAQCRRRRKALKAGLCLPPTVVRPDCQPESLPSSRSRNQSIIVMRGFRRATAYAFVRYFACLAQLTPKSGSGGFVW